MHSLRTYVLDHLVGRAALDWFSGVYIRTSRGSDDRESIGVPIVLQNTHFVAGLMVQTQTRHKQLQNTMHDEKAANMSATVVLSLADCVSNVTHSKPPVMKQCSMQAEDVA